MGASEWRYFVPYQEDLNQALQNLRQQVFSTDEYWWYGDSEYLSPANRSPRPARLEDLFEDEYVREEGTHSILDVFRVVDPDRPRDWYDHCTIVPATADEVRAAIGTDRPTRTDTAELDDKLPRARKVDDVIPSANAEYIPSPPPPRSPPNFEKPPPSSSTELWSVASQSCVEHRRDGVHADYHARVHVPGHPAGPLERQTAGPIRPARTRVMD